MIIIYNIMRVRVRASVTVSVRDVTIIFIGLSVYNYIFILYMKPRWVLLYYFIFKDVDDTVTTVLSFSTAGHRRRHHIITILYGSKSHKRTHTYEPLNFPPGGLIIYVRTKRLYSKPTLSR